MYTKRVSAKTSPTLHSLTFVSDILHHGYFTTLFNFFKRLFLVFFRAPSCSVSVSTSVVLVFVTWSVLESILPLLDVIDIDLPVFMEDILLNLERFPVCAGGGERIGELLDIMEGPLALTDIATELGVASVWLFGSGTDTELLLDKKPVILFNVEGVLETPLVLIFPRSLLCALLPDPEENSVLPIT